MLDLDNAVLPKSIRPLPKRINGHVLSIDDLKGIARWAAGRADPILGEELVAILFPQMLGAESGRHIPAEVLHHIGEGNISAGRQVVRKLIANLRNGSAHYQHGGAVHHDDADEHLDLAPEALERAEQVGGKLGSNPGGTFTGFADGRDRYIKIPKHDDQARQEVLAGKFYDLLGVPAARTELTRTPDGKLAVASQIIPGVEELKHFPPMPEPGAHPWDYIKDLREHFAADSWLGNSDAIGKGMKNILVDPQTLQAYRIDHGASFDFGPEGRTKRFGNTAAELKTMKERKYRSSEIFGGLQPSPDDETAQKIAAVPDATIRELVHRYLDENAAFGRNDLADRLIARRDDLAKQYGISRS